MKLHYEVEWRSWDFGVGFWFGRCFGALLYLGPLTIGVCS